jgi:hypothetical protein
MHVSCVCVCVCLVPSSHIVEGLNCMTPLDGPCWVKTNRVAHSSGGCFRYMWLLSSRTQGTTDAALIGIAALNLPASGNPWASQQKIAPAMLWSGDCRVLDGSRSLSNAHSRPMQPRTVGQLLPRGCLPGSYHSSSLMCLIRTGFAGWGPMMCAVPWPITRVNYGMEHPSLSSMTESPNGTAGRRYISAGGGGLATPPTTACTELCLRFVYTIRTM